MTFSKEFIDICEYICSKFGIAIDWSSSNLLPKLEELLSKYITWEISTSIFWMILMLIIFIICLFVFQLAEKRIKNSQYTDSEAKQAIVVAKYIVMCFIGLITIAVIASQAYDIITCINFPEKIILEYLMSIKNNLMH